MARCELCTKPLRGRQLLYCGKNCASRACKIRKGKIKSYLYANFEPTCLSSFYESEEARRLCRLQVAGKRELI